MDQTQTPRYVSRFELLLYVPAFTQKDFHYVHTGPPTQGTSTEKLQYKLRSIQLLSPTQPPLHKRQGTTTITSHKRDKALSQTTIISHKRAKALSQTTITITSTQRGIATNSKHNLLYT